MARMNKKTAKALEGSIEKWKAIVAGTGTDEGHYNCPLCALFFYDDCAGCPVMKKTGFGSCSNSPYDDYCQNPTRARAKKELAFLISLRPESAQE